MVFYCCFSKQHTYFAVSWFSIWDIFLSISDYGGETLFLNCVFPSPYTCLHLILAICLTSPLLVKPADCSYGWANIICSYVTCFPWASLSFYLLCVLRADYQLILKLFEKTENFPIYLNMWDLFLLDFLLPGPSFFLL